MGNSCNHCCGEIQDWCRDSCGCCPCDCCKTTDIEMTVETVDDKIVKKKDIPYGYGRIYAGVQKADNSYTSPILEIHTWHKEVLQINMNKATVSQRVALGGIQTERDNADRRIGPLRRTEHRKIELDEEIQCIPIESIISIKYSSEIKKELTEQLHARLKTPPPGNPSCCTKLNRWCCRTFCCCCNDGNNQVDIDPLHTITQIVDEKGERMILMTIEYIRYNNINSPSYFNALATTDAAVYYKDRLHTDILQFYLLNNQEFEQTDFELKRMQGEILCRLITQLKAMAGQFPDESMLRNMIHKHEVQIIGDPPHETMDQLVGPRQIPINRRTEVPIHAIQN